MRIQEAITAVLAEVPKTYGDTETLEGHVFRGRALFGDDDPLPMIAILEDVDEKLQVPTPVGGQTSKTPWTLLVQGFAEDDRLNPSDPAQELLALVKQRLTREAVKAQGTTPGRPPATGPGTGPFGMGNVITSMRMSPGVVRPADEVNGKAYFWFRLTLEIVENGLDPFK
ncbi:tail terminator [Pseudomonas phage PspYZU01]|uniref:Uncharacterized protein n=1 Tax=Pseudomonas phage PspYZU01 TaxID=1983555 RepID=A0A2U7N2D9_9CAUD|nr:tail terminator [Pseudomonas phage PspYZU01]ASD51925.1 hypothetical protein PspYZU01_40 [Pseudomonas phage PspYZU01]